MSPDRHIRAEFVRVIGKHGVRMPTTRILRLSDVPLHEDGETDCWTLAHQYTRANPEAVYIEGLCKRVSRPGIGFVHAWCVERGPLGLAVIEVTPGYQDAFDYVGIPVDPDETEQDQRRYSVLELAIFESLKDTLGSTGTTRNTRGRGRARKIPS